MPTLFISYRIEELDPPLNRIMPDAAYHDGFLPCASRRSRDTIGATLPEMVG